jgi:hypothetical protein
MFRPLARPSENSGFVMILVIVLIGAIVSVVVIKTALFSLSHLQTAVIVEGGEHAKELAHGCAAEALIHLAKKSTFTTSTYDQAYGHCDVTVSGSGATRTILINANINSFYHSLTLTVNMSPFSVTGWDN